MVAPWVGPVMRTTTAAFIHTVVPLMVLEYGNLPQATAAVVHFTLLIAGSITVVMWGRCMGPNVAMILALCIVLNAPLWLAYGLVHADPAPAVQYPMVCVLILIFLFTGTFLNLPGDLVGMLCVVLLVADTLNSMLASAGKRVSLLVTLVFLMAVALAAVVVAALNTLVLPTYATDEALCRHEVVLEKLNSLVRTVLGAPPAGPTRQPPMAPKCTWLTQLSWCCPGTRPKHHHHQQHQQQPSDKPLQAAGEGVQSPQAHSSMEGEEGSSKSVLWGLLGAMGLVDDATTTSSSSSSPDSPNSSSKGDASGVEEAWWQVQAATDAAVGAAAGTALELYLGRLGPLRLFVPALLPCCGLTTAQLPHTTLFLIRQSARDTANTAQGLAALLGLPPSTLAPALDPPKETHHDIMIEQGAQGAGVAVSRGPSGSQVAGGGGGEGTMWSHPVWCELVELLTAALEDMVQAAPLEYRMDCPALTAAHLRAADAALQRLEQQQAARGAAASSPGDAEAGMQQQQQQQQGGAWEGVVQQQWPEAPGTFLQQLSQCNQMLLLLQARRLMEQLMRLHDLVGQLRSHVAAGGRQHKVQKQRRASVAKGKAEGPCPAQDINQTEDGAPRDGLCKSIELLPVSSNGASYNGAGGEALSSAQEEAVLLQPDTQWSDALGVGLSHPLLHR